MKSSLRNWLLLVAMVALVTCSLSCGPQPAAPAQPTEAAVVEAPTEAPAAAEPTAAPAVVEPTAAPVVEAPTEPPAPAEGAPITEGPESVVTVPRGQIDNLDPSRLPSVNDVDMQRKIFEPLVDYMDDGTELLQGAERYEANENADVYTFYLRKEAKWSDGQPVTAHDYVYGWRRLFDPEMANTNASTVYIIKNGSAINNGEIQDLTQLGAEAVDDYTLKVTLEQSAGYFPKLLNGLYPVRQDIVEKFGDKWVEPANIVGNGPYLLKEWEKDVRLVFERNPNYWGEPPKIAKIVYLTMEDPYSSGIDMYEAGELDMTPFKPEDYARIQEDPALADQILLQSQATVYWVVFDTSTPPFDDVRVRQAFNLAVDRESYVSGVMQGLGIPAYIIPAPNVVARNEEAFIGTKDYAQDVEKARQLLAEAGYPNGEGFPEVELKYRTRFLEQKMGEALPAMWEAALGVKVVGSPTEAQAYRAWFQSRAEQPYNMMVYGWIADNEPVNWFNAVFTTDADLYHSHWSNLEFDDIVTRAAAERDPAQRIELYKQAGVILERETPYLPVLHVVEPYLIQPWLTGPVTSSAGYYNLQWGAVTAH